MIYIFIGDDSKNINASIKELTAGRESSFANNKENDKNIILNYASTVSLFGEYPVIIFSNYIKESGVNFFKEDLELMKESRVLFIFKEDKMLVSEQNKYKKYAEVKIFENKKEIVKDKFNVFSITDAFSNKDKIGAWTLYRKAIEGGVEPEAISGILFWKIKTMIINGSKVFSKDELKKQSSLIVSMYHKAHRGEIDFVLALEQFILRTLSSK